MENGNGSKEINNAKFKRDHSSRYRSQPEASGKFMSVLKLALVLCNVHFQRRES